MIRRGIGLASAAALALAVVTVPGPASLVSAAQGTTTASAPVAWVANESVTSLQGSATPIDTATNKVLRKIRIPLPPLDVVVTPDGTTAYVSTDGSGAGRPGYVYPVSTATGKLGKRIRVGVFSAAMAVTPNGKTLYVLNEQSNTVTPISTATNTAGRPIKVGQDPMAIVFSHGGKTAYVLDSPVNAFSARAFPRGCGFNCRGNVIPINTATNTAGRPITVGPTPGAMVITPNGKTVYVLNLASGERGKGTVTPISTTTNTAGQAIKITGSFPDALNLMVITPNGKTLYAVGNTVMTPISTTTNTAGRPIRVAPHHSGDVSAAITPDGRTVYVAGDLRLIGKGFIVPVSTATGAVGPAIIVHGLPEVMAFTPDGNTLYVLCAGEPGLGVPQDVIPVSTATNTAGPAIQTGLEPIAIAITTGH